MMKGRTLQAYSLRHSINKGMFSVYGKLDLFKLRRGGSYPPPSSPLGYTSVKIKQETTRVLLKKNKTAKRNKNLLCKLKKMQMNR